MRSSSTHSSALTAFVVTASFWIAASAFAQAPAAPPPRPGMQPVGETVVDRPSAAYRFETHRMDSADGKRHYRIQIAIPKRPATQGGRPALYMLDGNAALASLTDEDLLRLGAAPQPPVLVALGYDVDTRHDVTARAFDYTPPVVENGKRLPNPVVRGREGGGADLFLELIRTRVEPLVAARAHVDPERQYLWGHSYGGLFALHVLFTQPDAFARYIAGDPSAWWHEGVLLDEWERFEPARAADKRVAILVGTRPRTRPTPAAAVQTQDEARAQSPATPARQPVDLVATGQAVVDALRAAGADATFEVFPQFGHGDMLRASLERALEVAAAP